MGYMRHHTIVVTGIVFSKELRGGIPADIVDAHKKAKTIFPIVSPLSQATMNGYRSFFIAPDGSKEGWQPSDQGDLDREAFKRWLNAHRFSDKGSPFDWVEVQFGDDEEKTRIISDNDHKGDFPKRRLIHPR